MIVDYHIFIAIIQPIVPKIMKVFFFTLFISLCIFAATSVGLVLAAAPDGSGPWADQVVSSSQGLMKNGSPVPAVRSNPTAALGVAENDTADGTFFSLGFGGQITLHFDNGVRNGAIIVESTNPSYPLETAQVEVSADNSTWTVAGNVSQDGQVNIPENLTCVNYVRVTDTSDPSIFPDDIADGYDVDGVQAVNSEPCATPNPTPAPTPSDNPGPTPTPSSSSNSNQCTDAKPSTPSLTSVVRNSSTTATLTWTSVSPVSYYTISYGTSAGNYTYGVPNTGNTTSFTIGGLAANTNYYFVVRAVNGCTPGDPSGEKSIGGGQVLGASTSTGGQVLGASTDSLAATGRFANLNLSSLLLATGVTLLLLAGGLLWLK